VKQERLRVGVVGVGHLGEYHVQKYMALPNVELVGVVDTDPHRLNEISERYGVASYGTHADLLKHVEALSLAVPTEKHFEVARAGRYPDPTGA